MGGGMDDLHVYRITCANSAVAVLNEFLDAADIQYSCNEAVDSGVCELTVYPDPVRGGGEFLARLSGLCAATTELVGEPIQPPVQAVIRHEDWAESWKRHFPVTRLSRRVVVKPHWETYAAEVDDVVLEIDPGMSFGTGHHGTTQACVQFLDELASGGMNGPVLDLGCGSGILSMAALRLGYESVVAVDYDDAACAIARENLMSLNDPRWGVVHAGVDSFPVERTYPVVVANILAGVLLDHAEAIAAHVEPAPASRLILSGILDSQFDEVRQRYGALGFDLVEDRLLNEWRSGLFKPGDHRVV